MNNNHATLIRIDPRAAATQRAITRNMQGAATGKPHRVRRIDHDDDGVAVYAVSSGRTGKAYRVTIIGRDGKTLSECNHAQVNGFGGPSRMCDHITAALALHQGISQEMELTATASQLQPETSQPATIVKTLTNTTEQATPERPAHVPADIWDRLDARARRSVAAGDLEVSRVDGSRHIRMRLEGFEI